MNQVDAARLPVWVLGATATVLATFRHLAGIVTVMDPERLPEVMRNLGAVLKAADIFVSNIYFTRRRTGCSEFEDKSLWQRSIETADGALRNRKSTAHVSDLTSLNSKAWTRHQYAQHE